MLIIDLDTDQKRPAHVTPPNPPRSAGLISVAPPEETKPVTAPNPIKTEGEKLLWKLEEEDNHERYLRAMTHQRYFDLLGPDLLPIEGADFSEIYQEMRVHQDRLKSIWLKKEQVKATGSLQQPKFMTDADLARLGSMKHERSNAYKLIAKKKKKIKEAEIKGNAARVQSLESEVNQIEMKILNLSHQIKIIQQDAILSR
ncbi:hypothetical protein V8V91_08570 [Algoriphagus halophilus]|uniref:hypothetical protein n=1 Tax=Algoriphagus halophilus TaxID=226505 RepID=UPI00358F5F2C